MPSRKSNSRKGEASTNLDDNKKSAEGSNATPAAPVRASVATTQTKERRVAEDNTPSIIEYSEDISTQEAPEPLPAGDYMANIREVVEKTSNSGNDYLAVSFVIDPSQYPADYDAENNPDGVTLTYRRLSRADTPRARYAMRKFCEAIGAPCGKTVDTSEWLSRDARVTIAHDTFEGEKREQIRKVSAP